MAAQRRVVVLSGAGFSLWVLGVAQTKTHRLKPVLLKTI